VFTRRRTPARRLVTAEIRWDGEKWTQREAVDVAGAEVRVRIEMREDHAQTCPLEEIEAAFAGADAVKLERRILPKTRVRSEAITRAVTTEEKLVAYWDSLGKSAPSAEQRTRALAKYSGLYVTDAERPETQEEDAA